ncbi:hypothetical protein [Streptomyces shenzhenensis]|uniref:hypothetical protein n=1 Tax=Streptomyces shenzhenensis TaxID=943815 RepID=UPI0015F06A65|nr:hypothetical protein [Streptomyces shenzhenensis]
MPITLAASAAYRERGCTDRRTVTWSGAAGLPANSGGLPLTPVYLLVLRLPVQQTPATSRRAP